MKSFIVFFLLISAVHAQEHSFLTPMGAYEGIAGNTGIGRNGSVGSVIYNPAGMASIKSSKLSASGSAFSQNEIQIKSEGENDSINYFQTTPSQITTIFNTNHFNWAFSILVPKASKFDTISDSGDLSSLSTIEDNETLFGPSIAFKVTRNFSLGLSLFASKRDYREVSSAYYSDNTGELTQSRKQDVSAITAFPLLGVFYRFNRNFQMGLRLSAPSVNIDGNQEDNVKTAGDNTSLGIPNSNTTLKSAARFQKPAELGVGVSMKLTDQLNLLIDINHQVSSKYKAYDEDVFGDPLEFEFKDSQRFNLAFEYLTSQTDAITMGAMYNPDPEMDSELDFIGGTIGYRSIDKIADSSFGFFYNQATDKSGAGEFAFKSYGVFISSSINFLN